MLIDRPLHPSTGTCMIYPGGSSQPKYQVASLTIMKFDHLNEEVCPHWVLKLECLSITRGHKLPMVSYQIHLRLPDPSPMSLCT